jgi:N-acetylglucosaminyldiphosphoundecaprenol N-acetyl-beta-D-mannosaminyltransferase
MPLILGSCIDSTSYAEASARIFSWAALGESRYVCVANVHMVMEAYDDAKFRQIINTADLVTPDGMPLVWVMRLQGLRQQERVYGPALTQFVLEAANREGIPVGFYGSTLQTLEKLKSKVQERYPSLKIAYLYAPPFRPLTPEEDDEVVRAINDSGTRILFVGLGCPKQERWMAAHKGRVQAVMLGVGAAFDFLAGVKPQAPRWMQRAGLEWLFRLLSEPRRLWRRYAKVVPLFILYNLLEILQGKFYRSSSIEGGTS